MRAPLVLTGGPAAGKSATSRQVAARLRRAAVIDVDDVRQLVVTGHAAPWDGAEGARQQRIGIENACDLARRFLAAEIDVILCDVLDPVTTALYRRLLPAAVIVRLRVPPHEARRRAALRPVHLTAGEFERLHAVDEANHLAVDHTVDVEHLSVDDQARAVLLLWPEGQ